MFFILQKEKELPLDPDVSIVASVLNRELTHSYITASIDDLEYIFGSYATNDTKSKLILAEDNKKELNHISVTIDNQIVPLVIPVGTIEFVQRFLSIVYHIDNMPPLEVPQTLREQRYLSRSYRIVPQDELPTQGKYFIKQVDKLKGFNFLGDTKFLQQNIKHYDDMIKQQNKQQVSNKQLNAIDATYANKKYLVSEIVDIVSEWRVFVHRGKIINCIQYEWHSDDLCFPNANFVIEVVNKLSTALLLNKEYLPQSYTLDIGVLRDNKNCVIEMHPWSAIGLYGYMFGSDLLYAYQDGLAYYINYPRNNND